MTSTAEFPHYCLRGLRGSKCIQNGEVAATAFLPDERTAANRPDGRSETSINFDDDREALVTTQKDTNNAKYGVAKLSLEAIDYASLALGRPLRLDYERSPTPTNKYHGNILFSGGLRKRETATLAAVLATRATLIESHANTDTSGASSGSIESR
ncbi:hypothetical protein [Polyangium jinanense]|uniref:Uncharacterized protein n=1 Tax=Polyangium jinanense TaxID=2829994 RepID=A0A9X3XFK5_9BACT|nr:hypothetical protein [Polyangium jinanense]MDC3962652.1 hypothetical protein [Polyangium jinanense]MDC3989372.1 hypothetical protein [Polyangium jinanense]